MTIWIDFDDTIYKCNDRLSEYAKQDVVDYDIRKYGLTTDVFSDKDFYINDEKYVIENSLECIKKLSKLTDVRILTKIVKPIEVNYKQEFLNHFNLDIPLICIQSHVDKQDYLGSDDFLIDDSNFNLSGNSRNILFDYRNKFDKSWNVDLENIFVKKSSWLDIYKYIKSML